jgi:PhzF family phenazine biosynthesis protein
VTTHTFKQIDVFSNKHFRGNPVAVVLDAEGISDDEMQAIAAWTNLSETTFFQPATSPDADYLLRIYTPRAEIPFAGHPTIGSAHAAIEAGAFTPNDGKLRQQCGIGVIEITIDGDRPDRIISFEASPKVVHNFESSRDAISAALGAEIAQEPSPTSVDVGAVWTIVRFEHPSTVKNLKPDMTATARLAEQFNITGIAAFAFGGEDGADVRLRCFAPAFGVPEDPVTGSANACLGRFLAETGMIDRVGREYTVSQGTEMGREGRVHIRVSEDGRRVSVGGQAVTTVDGTISV